MLLLLLPDNPTVADVDHAISRARQAAVRHRAAGNERLALLAEQAVNAAFEVRTSLRLRLCYADHRCTSTPAVSYCMAHGNEVRLCRDHLNLWLDMADEDEEMEPVELTWLAGGE